jgi:hypothetical protein
MTPLAAKGVVLSGVAQAIPAASRRESQGASISNSLKRNRKRAGNSSQSKRRRPK